MVESSEGIEDMGSDQETENTKQASMPEKPSNATLIKEYIEEKAEEKKERKKREAKLKDKVSVEKTNYLQEKEE